MMAKNEKKIREEINEKLLEGISSWRLIYDKERDIYIKVACISRVVAVKKKEQR